MGQYISNKDFYSALVERRALLDAMKEGDQKPQITKYLGECILMIAKKLATKGNFAGYSFKEEMISDGVENCILYFDKFNIDRSNNPFSYYTQIIYFAFLRRIAKEKHQFLLKHKIIQSVGETVLELQGHDDDKEFVNSYREFLKEFSNVELVDKERKVRDKKIVESETTPLDALFV